MQLCTGDVWQSRLTWRAPSWSPLSKSPPSISATFCAQNKQKPGLARCLFSSKRPCLAHASHITAALLWYAPPSFEFLQRLCGPEAKGLMAKRLGACSHICGAHAVFCEDSWCCTAHTEAYLDIPLPHHFHFCYSRHPWVALLDDQRHAVRCQARTAAVQEPCLELQHMRNSA